MTCAPLPDPGPAITQAINRSNRTRWWLTLAVAAVIIGALMTLGVFAAADQAKLNDDTRQLHADTTALARTRAALEVALARQRASCGFYHDLTPLPITTGPTGKASRLGVQIVSDSRATYVGQGCPGPLPPPDPSFVRWARYFGIPIIETGAPPP